MTVVIPVPDQVSTRERILDAALTAFADRGVDATSLDSLATTIGVRKQTILYWFASKEVLLLGVIDHAVADLGARLSDAALTARSTDHPRQGSDPSDTPASQHCDAQRSEPTSVRLVEHADASDTSGSQHCDAQRSEQSPADLVDRLVAVVDATFRLGSTHPQLLAVVREVARVGPPATTHLVSAVEPLVATAIAALPADTDPDRVRTAVLAAGARVVGLATEAEVRADLGLAPDLAWLRARRRDLITSLTHDLS